MKTLRLSSLIKLNSEGVAERWMPIIIPDNYNLIHTAKGKFVVDSDAIIRAFRNGGNDLVIDYEHGSTKGVESPAAGWINELEAQVDGSLYAKVEWTEKAAGYIRNREYRYLSPAFVPEGDKITGLHSIALTNVPATYSASPVALNKDRNLKELDMDFKKILVALGLAPDADEVVCLAAIQLLKEMHSKTLTVLSLPAAATAAEVEKKIVALKDTNEKALKALSLSAAATSAEVEGKIVALSGNTTQLETLQKEVIALTNNLKERDAKELVALAQSEGKLAPAQAEWANKYALESPEGFKTWMSSASPIIALTKGLEPKKPESKELSGSQEEILKACGVTAEDFKKYGLGG